MDDWRPCSEVIIAGPIETLLSPCECVHHMFDVAYRGAWRCYDVLLFEIAFLIYYIMDSGKESWDDECAK